ncbi:MAG: hypothetical protein M3457_22825 [Chloroflexota bacterium]|nr:hypothetical protein [Chloroflexota bacterium]
MATSTAKPDISDEAMREGSGKSWDEWVHVLDAWGAAEKPHKEIAQYVCDLGVDGWWAQGVTVGYERIKGLRAHGQRRDGHFEGSASKTFPVPVDRLAAAWIDETERDRWLEPGILILWTAQDGRSARFDIADGGILALWFTNKGPGKSSVALTCDKLPSKAAADAFRETWKAYLASLAKHLRG